MMFKRAVLGTLLSSAALVLAWVPAGRAEDAPQTTASLVFVGDVMLDRIPGEHVAKGKDPFADCASILEAADLTVGNLECVVATGGERVVKKYTFRASPHCLPFLTRYFDAVSLANNHTGDFGKGALVEEMERLEQAGVRYFGGGRDLKEAHSPLILERKGIRVALLGYNEFRPREFEAGPMTPGVAWSDDDQVVADLKAVRASGAADIVITFMHWGREYQFQPNERQKSLARLMIDSGADVVIGGHPHVTEGAEYYKGKLIVYSLGNFVFDDFKDVVPALDEPSRTSWALRLKVAKSGLVEWDTVVTRTGDDGFPRPLPNAPSPKGRDGKIEPAPKP
ncbi:MAG: CapA family protein [Isosphaeraceae bacterium]|nr:CapA family protein [Isosphaeraceae bacterium]